MNMHANVTSISMPLGHLRKHIIIIFVGMSSKPEVASSLLAIRVSS
jgi:hypothetical protein